MNERDKNIPHSCRCEVCGATEDDAVASARRQALNDMISAFKSIGPLHSAISPAHSAGFHGGVDYCKRIVEQAKQFDMDGRTMCCNASTAGAAPENPSAFQKACESVLEQLRDSKA